MMRRQMARRVHRKIPVSAITGLAVLVGVAAFVLIVVLAAGRLGGAGASPSVPASSLVAGAGGSPSARPSPSAIASPGLSSGSPQPSATGTAAPTAGATPGATGTPAGTPTASATPSTSASPPANAAPTSAADFNLQNQLIDIGFPLRADTTYHYRDNWYERRAGPPDTYNHAKVGKDGTLVRLHDGIDLYASEGQPVLAPFSGTIIDPQTKWSPWHPDRYGLTVVIESDEPTSAGYTAVMVHLKDIWVDLGQHVERGQVIGDVGQTGDANGIKPQLHFELRAPFLLDWTPIGEDRLVDAFNPFPSLQAADPNF